MVAVVDYGVGNLFSLRASLEYLGQTVEVTGDPGRLAGAERLILPGVGAFGDAADRLRATGLDRTVVAAAKAGTPLLGICLGMQLLMERSFEFGEHAGLGLLRGDVTPIAPLLPAGYKVPQIGWNSLSFPEGRKLPIFRQVEDGAYVYFVHSYHAGGSPDAAAFCRYGAVLTAAVGRDNVFGCQFHPEKSGDVGLRILRAFCEL